jgi:probable F420-dependent oxidoreductase
MDFVLPLMDVPLEEYVSTAVLAERLGFHSVAFADHVVTPRSVTSPYPSTPDGRMPWDETKAYPEPWVAAAAMASCTSSLRFMSGIYILPMRNPILAAHAVATAAIFSGGRVILGVGVGWMREEFEALASDFSTRGKRTDEAIALMRSLWAGGYVEHRGEFYATPPVHLCVTPPGPIPIYFGGGLGPAMERAARLGDGWILPMGTSARTRELIDAVKSCRRELGTGDQPFAIIADGSGCETIADFHRLEEMGATGVRVTPWRAFPPDTGVFDKACREHAMELFANKVLQHFGR